MIGRMLVCCFIFSVAITAQPAERQGSDKNIESSSAAVALPKLTQVLFDAVAPGDKGPWQRYLSDRFAQTDESGARMNKSEMLASLGPLPPGMSGSIAVTSVQVADFGEFAVIRYDLDEHELVFGQTLHVIYRATDTWRREHNRWRMVASQVMTVAQDPPPLPSTTAINLETFVGLYDLGGQRRYRVERRGDELAMGREGGKLELLVRVGDNVFVTKGDPLAIQYIFLRGADGAIDRIVERRKFADLQLLRVRDAAPLRPV